MLFLVSSSLSSLQYLLENSPKKLRPFTETRISSGLMGHLVCRLAHVKRQVLVLKLNECITSIEGDYSVFFIFSDSTDRSFNYK